MNIHLPVATILFMPARVPVIYNEKIIGWVASDIYIQQIVIRRVTS